ncbi:MAG: DUF3574 domain-containing protein [Verrucomicrobiota bacterium]|nr:DUF3574 domain-containing protein [Verrucomicrobiota bacterium]
MICGVSTARAETATQVTTTLQADSARPASAQWVRSELYFGLGKLGVKHAGVSDKEWQAFLDKEVTPRFPDGLTVFEAYGQWRDAGQKSPQRERSKVLIILHENTPERRAALDAIRSAWKILTKEQYVLLVTQAVEVSF